VLGLERALLHEVPTTAHFLFGEKCVNNCAFCAQARSSNTGPHHLSRVTWPAFSWSEIEGPLESALDAGIFKRVCIQTVECPESPGSALEFARKVRGLSPGAYISVCTAPTSWSRVKLYMDAGATNVGLPVDAACPRVYAAVKGGPDGAFEGAWSVLEKCASLWPGRISTHLIVGLGETEEEAVRFLVRAEDAGITVGLFAFTPVRRTAMERRRPPDIASYRRVQLAAYYLKRGEEVGGIEFRGGRISRLSFPERVLQGVTRGDPFRTSGCLHCNRPYYNERPGHVMMNYPRPLSDDEVREAIALSGLLDKGYPGMGG